MGVHKLGTSKGEKYLGDQIISASITETLDKREKGLTDKLEDLMNLAEHASLKGMNSAMAAIIQFETQVVTKLLHNCENWIGLTEDHILRLLEIQHKFRPF